jgi:hypothetical protein
MLAPYRSRKLHIQASYTCARARIPFLSVLLALTVAALLGGTTGVGQAASAPEHWISTWAAPAVARTDQPAQTLSPAAQAYPWAQDVPSAVREAAANQQLEIGGMSRLHFKDQTLRQIAHVSIGGSRVRVVLANSLGTLPLRIGAAQVALRDKGASIVDGSNRALTFGGIAQPVIPAGALLVSDPVDLKVQDFGDVVVDLYLPEDTAAWKSPLTVHPASWQVNYVSTPGNHAGTTTFPVASTTAYRRGDGLPSASSFLLSRIEVVAPQATGVLVAFGDSITDGTQSGIGYPPECRERRDRRRARARRWCWAQRASPLRSRCPRATRGDACYGP